jgi:hypothetical protein
MWRWAARAGAASAAMTAVAVLTMTTVLTIGRSFGSGSIIGALSEHVHG